MEQNNETTALLARADSLGGPRLGGTVNVQLSELDQLRADYVNAVKAYKELALHVKEVRVVLVPGDDTGNQIVKGAGKKEVVTWKNMDEIRTVIAMEERNKLQTEIDQHNTRAEEAMQKVFAAESVLSDMKISTQEMRKDHAEEVKRHKRTIKEMEALLEEAKNNLAAVTAQLEEEVAAHNDLNTQYEKLKQQFDDISHKYVELEELQRPWWKFW